MAAIEIHSGQHTPPWWQANYPAWLNKAIIHYLDGDDLRLRNIRHSDAQRLVIETTRQIEAPEVVAKQIHEVVAYATGFQGQPVTVVLICYDGTNTKVERRYPAQ